MFLIRLNYGKINRYLTDKQLIANISKTGQISVITSYCILCMARTVFSILVTVRLYTVMPAVCRRLTNEKQTKTAFRLTDQ